MVGKYPDTYGDSDLDLDNRLPPCPNCGSALESFYIGNMHTKKRSIKVKCANRSCRIERTDSAIYHDFIFLEEAQLKIWRTAEPTKGDSNG